MTRPNDSSRTAFVVSAIFLVFLFGFIVGAYRIPPYELLAFLFGSVEEVWKDRGTITHTRPDEFLEPARHPGAGVTTREPEGMAPGLTLMAGFFGDTNEIRLVDREGVIVNQWPVAFHEIFPDADHIQPPGQRPQTNWNTDLHGVLAFPDGSVVFNFEYGGMVKLDRCGASEWILPRMTHHSIDLSGNGSLWVPGRSFRLEQSEYPPVSAPYQDELLLQVSQEGEVLREISALALFFQNGLESILLSNGQFEVTGRSDLEVVHLNDIEELSASMADAFPLFTAGDLVLSFRHLNLIMVVDPETLQVKWHRTGPYIRQHDPDFQASGTITLFDNQTDASNGEVFGGSRILELDPVSGEVAVLYGGENGQHMYTEVRGSHQKLSNGNLLITETLAGRIVEVTPDGDIVWEYINRYDEDEVAWVSNAIRYPEGYFQVSDWSCN